MKKKKSTNRFAKIFIVLVLILGASFVFRGAIFRTIAYYKEDGSRKNYKVKDKNLALFIENHLKTDQARDIESIVNLSQEITDKALTFSLESKENDPNKTVLLGRANCIGYAALTASIGNYLIDKYKLSEVWEAKPVKGKLFVFGADMHSQFKNNKNFKDHDFVIFRNKITKKEIAIDPTVYDRFGIERISKR